jgi:hypothetical protein
VVEKVPTSRTVSMIISVLNHAGLNPNRNTEVLAVSINAASHALSIIKDKLVKSRPMPWVTEEKVLL